LSSKEPGASFRGDQSPSVARQILEIGTDPEVAARYPAAIAGGTALHIAARSRNVEAVETPLHYAAQAQCAKSAAILLKSGATLRPRDSLAQTPLMLACQVGATEVIALLVDHSIDKNILDLAGKTALHHAAQGTSPKIFSDLIDANWDPYKRDSYHNSPVTYAICGQRLGAYVLAKSLDLEHLSSSTERSSTVSHGLVPGNLRRFLRRYPRATRAQYLSQLRTSDPSSLVRDSLAGKIERMEILLKAGASIGLCNGEVCTALNAACLSGQLASVKLLVRHGAKLECSRDKCTKNALETAKQNPKIVHWFLVGRYVDQCKITNETIGGADEAEVRFWSGVRQVEVPLQGGSERPVGVSSLEYAIQLHRKRDGWRSLVPLEWDTVAHLTPFIGE
jgi:ankyrin repeat protein